MPSSKELSMLGSWTEIGGDAVKNFSGTAKYSITFDKPAGKADAFLLNLGKVCESARIYLNGSEISGLIGPDYQTIILLLS